MSTVKTNGNFVLKIGSTGAVSLGAAFPSGMQDLNRIDIQALGTNVGLIYVGDNTVLSDGSVGGIALGVSQNGQGLNVGDVYSIEILRSIQSIFINGQTNDGVMVTWWVGER